MRSIALSADSRQFLATGEGDGKIKKLRDVLLPSYSTVSNYFVSRVPFFHITDAATLRSIPGSRTGSQTWKHR